MENKVKLTFFLILFIFNLTKTTGKYVDKNVLSKFEKNDILILKNNKEEMILYIQIISKENIEYRKLDNYGFDENLKKNNHYFINNSIIFNISTLDIKSDDLSIKIKNFEGYLIYGFEKQKIKFKNSIPLLSIEDTYKNGSDTYNSYSLKYHHNGLKTNYSLYLYLLDNKNNIPNSIYQYAENEEKKLTPQTTLIYKFTNDQKVEKIYSYNKIYIKKGLKLYGHLIINQIEEVNIYYLFPDIDLNSFKLNYLEIFIIIIVLIAIISISCCICAICNCCVRITECGLGLINCIIDFIKCIFVCVKRICCCSKNDNAYIHYKKGNW